jgi:hypothetical protein
MDGSYLSTAVTRAAYVILEDVILHACVRAILTHVAHCPCPHIAGLDPHVPVFGSFVWTANDRHAPERFREVIHVFAIAWIRPGWIVLSHL